MDCLVILVIFMAFTIVNCQQKYEEQNPQYELKYLDKKTGQQGYDLFYYDGLSLRDEKWRFDPLTGVPVVNHRHGYRQKDSDRLHLFSTNNNGLGFSYSGMILNPENEKQIIANRVEVPMLFQNDNNVRQGPIQTIAGAVQTVSGYVGNVAGAVINPQAAFSNVVQKVGQQVVSGLQSAGQNVLSPFSGGSGSGGFNRPLANIVGNLFGRPGKQGENQQQVVNGEDHTYFNRPFQSQQPLLQQTQPERPPLHQIQQYIHHPLRPPFRPTLRPKPPIPTYETQSTPSSSFSTISPQSFPTLSPETITSKPQEPQPFPTMPSQPQPFPTMTPETITTKPQGPQPFPTLPSQPQPFPTIPPESMTNKPQGPQPFPTLAPQTTILAIDDIDVRLLGNVTKTDQTRILKPVIPGLPEKDEDYIDEEEGVGNRINPNAIKSLLG